MTGLAFDTVSVIQLRRFCTGEEREPLHFIDVLKETTGAQ